MSQEIRIRKLELIRSHAAQLRRLADVYDNIVVANNTMPEWLINKAYNACVMTSNLHEELSMEGPDVQGE